jgi:glutaminyl-peptide cyclotransferase
MKPVAALAALFVALASWTAAEAAAPVYGYQVVRSFPHDPGAFTEGLFLQGGFLYESTGLEGRSSIRKVALTTGKVVMQRDIPTMYFGEGIVDWQGKLIELTWQNEIGFIYDLKTFKPTGAFRYRGEGWALTRDDKRIIRITVTDEGRPVAHLNELEWIKGEVWANIWQTDRIARIDPKTGKVVGWIDLTGISNGAKPGRDPPDVLNGIAYDAAKDRIFVTGKFWSRLYEIKLVKR